MAVSSHFGKPVQRQATVGYGYHSIRNAEVRGSIPLGSTNS